MTLNQIKDLAKQAGGYTLTDQQHAIFTTDELTEFVRLVRENVLREIGDLPEAQRDMLATIKAQRRVIEQALEALIRARARKIGFDELDAAITALHTAIQEAESVEPVAWLHDCAALLQNDVEFWIDSCPHCGKPRTHPPTAPAQQEEAKEQAGVATHAIGYSMSGDVLIEFTRLVRESVLEEAAAQCRQLADCEENTEDYRNGAAWCAERIKGMK